MNSDGRGRRLLILLIATLAGACSTTIGPSAPPPADWSHLPAIRLDVARIEIVDAYRSPGQRPNIEELMAEPPAALAQAWARQRLRAVGSSGVARFTVTRAAILEMPLATSSGLTGLVNIEQAARYDGQLDVTLEIDDQAALAQRRGRVNATASASQSVPENITETGRQAVWAELAESLVARMNQELEETMPARLGALVKP